MAIKANDKEQIEKDGEARRAKAAVKAVEKAKADEATLPQQASKFSQQLDIMANVMANASSAIKTMRSKLIALENRANNLRHENGVAEKELATVQRKANLALQQSTQGTRALADRLAIERGKNEEKEVQLAAREKTIAQQAQELEELKALYESKLDSISKIPSATPGD